MSANITKFMRLEKGERVLLQVGQMRKSECKKGLVLLLKVFGIFSGGRPENC